MEFIDIVEKIKVKYRDARNEELAEQVNSCLMEGGTLGERFLIFADWLKELKVADLEKYNLAYKESELIIEGANNFFTTD